MHTSPPPAFACLRGGTRTKCVASWRLTTTRVVVKSQTTTFANKSAQVVFLLKKRERERERERERKLPPQQDDDDDDDDNHVKNKTNLNPFAWTVRAANEAKRQIRIVNLMGLASLAYMAWALCACVQCAFLSCICFLVFSPHRVVVRLFVVVSFVELLHHTPSQPDVNPSMYPPQKRRPCRTPPPLHPLANPTTRCTTT